jgi:hypothetical protein
MKEVELVVAGKEGGPAVLQLMLARAVARTSIHRMSMVARDASKYLTYIYLV